MGFGMVGGVPVAGGNVVVTPGIVGGGSVPGGCVVSGIVGGGSVAGGCVVSGIIGGGSVAGGNVVLVKKINGK